MTDRELLELAAKAAGLMPRDEWAFDDGWGLKVSHGDSPYEWWNPLVDDSEALRLAVKLGIQITPFLSGACKVETIDGWVRTECGYETAGAAARRAITRAAAEIGRAMS